MPGKPRPTIEEIERIVAAEIAAAERDLADSKSMYLERTVASPGAASESLDG
jgi:hypothetical protein